MYTDYLESRGYRRVPVERTSPQPGDIVIFNTRPAERVPAASRVVAMRRKERVALTLPSSTTPISS